VPSSRAWRLLHPKWLPLHLFTIAACVVMVKLGQWQWRVAHQHHGDIRYYAYAFQWWAFTGFAAVMWGRIVLDHLHAGKAEPEQPAEAAQPTDSGPRYRAYVPPSAPVDDDDPERARFNAYLAELNARSAAVPREQQ